MSEQLPYGYGGVEDWRGQYNTVKGPEKIEARQRVYWLVAEDEENSGETQRVDLELETLNALKHAGVFDDATIVDIGCSFPNFLRLWKLNGHLGRLIGIEPNTKQFNGLPYWQPGDSSQQSPISRLTTSIFKPGFEDIELIEAWADELPLEDGETDVATMMFMMYHVPKAVQRHALLEAKRIQDPTTGIFALTTRSRENKRILRRAETQIGHELSVMRGSQVTPPPPVNSGFTSEDAAEVLPQIYNHVYVYEHTADIIVDSPSAAGIIERAVWSLLDKYVDGMGQPPTEDQFDIAVDKVLGVQFQIARAGGLAIKDLLHESLFVASDRSLNLPKKFTRLA